MTKDLITKKLTRSARAWCLAKITPLTKLEEKADLLGLLVPTVELLKGAELDLDKEELKYLLACLVVFKPKTEQVWDWIQTCYLGASNLNQNFPS